MSPYVDQVESALGTGGHALALRVDEALMRAYWQGWDDGHTERGKTPSRGAAGRGVLAALSKLRVSHTPTPEPPQ